MATKEPELENRTASDYARAVNADCDRCSTRHEFACFDCFLAYRLGKNRRLVSCEACGDHAMATEPMTNTCDECREVQR